MFATAAGLNSVCACRSGVQTYFYITCNAQRHERKQTKIWTPWIDLRVTVHLSLRISENGGQICINSSKILS